MDNMTAKVSCFARAYHSKNDGVKVFDDTAAEKLLGKDYDAIAQSMIEGIQFLLPGFKDTEEKGLRLIVDRILSPSVLGRSAYCEKMLKNEIALGCGQYVILASGYDTYGIRNDIEGFKVFELDKQELFEDKNERIKAANLRCSSVQVPCNLAEAGWKDKLLSSGYNKELKSFGSLLGISYYLRKDEFEKLVADLSSIMTRGSAICFDYTVDLKGSGGGDDINPVNGVDSRNDLIRKLAEGAGEKMESRYSCDELVFMLQDYGFKIYEHLNAEEMDEQHFMEFNIHNRKRYISAPEGVAYCFAVKWR